MTQKHQHNLRFYEQAWRSATLVEARHWPETAAIAAWLEGDVLEVGPGMFPRCDHAHYLEASPETAARLQTLGRACTSARLEEAPLDDGAFDAVLAFDVLEHCDDDAQALAQVHRMLRPGGTFIVSVPLHQRYWSQLDVLAGHTFRYDPALLLATLQAAGFRPTQCHVYRPVHPAAKWLEDRLLLAAVTGLGAERAMRAKGWVIARTSRVVSSLSLVPWSGVVPEDANALLLVCERVVAPTVMARNEAS